MQIQNFAFLKILVRSFTIMVLKAEMLKKINANEFAMQAK